MARLERTVDTLLGIVCGPPTLEDKMRGYVDTRTDHKSNNVKQMIVDLVGLFRDEQKDTKTQFANLSRWVYIGLGIILAMQFVLMFLRK